MLSLSLSISLIFLSHLPYGDRHKDAPYRNHVSARGVLFFA